MIDRAKISEVVRYIDAESEEFEDMPAFWRKRGVEVRGLADVAKQRGLRIVMIRQGRSPNISQPTRVALTPSEQQDEIQFASAFMDGFAAGFEVAQRAAKESAGE